MRVSSFTGPGDGRPTPEQLDRWRRRMMPPENELPASTGLTLTLGKTDDALVAITRIEAYSRGFQFTLAIRMRQAAPEFAYGKLHMLVSPHPRPGFEIALEERLLLGIEYPDGQRASSLQEMQGAFSVPDDQQLVLASAGGGGSSEKSVDFTYWVSPLSGDGPLTFVMAWPGFGMTESRSVLDGAAIRAAAERSQVLWPPQPIVLERPKPSPPPRPSTGWFAEPPAE